MKGFNFKFTSILVILFLISAACAVTKETTKNEGLDQENKIFVSNTQGFEINKETIKNSLNLYQNLSTDKKTAIKDRMVKLSQKRQQNIEQVQKQIKEYKLHKNLQNAKSQVTQISQLQAIQKIALKENATETAKSLEILISWYENKQKIKTLDKNSL
ncbi:MAG: hypothetical protein JXA96_11720 [Sedimentisphaerales bacterium]|nr:hypothetical protein [Sedimentisphaerales bacterium]